MFNVGICHGGQFDKKPIDNFTKKYDILFNKASKRYFGVGFDYRQFKSQGYAESNLTPDAISPVGARGIMQIMPPTWKEQAKEGTPDEPKWAIPVGIKYNRQLYSQQTSPRPDVDRIALTFGSYNAGLGNILKGQNKCIEKTGEACNHWVDVIKYGDEVNTQIHDETDGYVKKIMKLMGQNLYKIAKNNIIDKDSKNVLKITILEIRF